MHTGSHLIITGTVLFSPSTGIGTPYFFKGEERESYWFFLYREARSTTVFILFLRLLFCLNLQFLQTYPQWPSGDIS